MRSSSDIQSDIDAIDAAISKALSAQSYSGGGRSVARGNLSTLYTERRRLHRELDRADNGAIRRGVISHVGGEYPE